MDGVVVCLLKYVVAVYPRLLAKDLWWMSGGNGLMFNELKI